ncbi:hypothetical protein GLYMA_05G074950v4 [Glycine max]|nr:hypothetical protein GLYMA_05G074950v4 [Glycine max]KAH1133244.1 hypothetical protein GYH30_011893 [Glycine max]
MLLQNTKHFFVLPNALLCLVCSPLHPKNHPNNQSSL